MGLLSFTHSDRSDHVVFIVDISSSGVGVESDEQMEPGLVRFHNRVGDYRSGMLLWCRKWNDRYRAGIRFVSLTDEDERFLRYWPPCPGQLRPCIDLKAFLSAKDEVRRGSALR